MEIIETEIEGQKPLTKTLSFALIFANIFASPFCKNYIQVMLPQTTLIVNRFFYKK